VETQNTRYNFGGFSFGSKGLFQLTIKTINSADYGTSNSLELGLELSQDERLELIKVLINAGQSESETSDTESETESESEVIA